jgi:hypothetical protein
VLAQQQVLPDLIERANLDLNHFNPALRLFPEDAEILFMGGARRKVLAAPRIQDGLRTTRLPSGLSYAIDSDRNELRHAEALFRRALTVDPTSVETHLRLGRARRCRKLAPAGARRSALGLSLHRGTSWRRGR